MKRLLFILLMLFSFSCFAQKEVQSYSIDSVKKDVADKGWSDCSDEWRNKLLQLDYNDHVFKIFKEPSVIYEYRMIPKMLTSYKDSESNQVFVYNCINTLGERCTLHFTFPPDGVKKNFITLAVLQPKVDFMFYLKAL